MQDIPQSAVFTQSSNVRGIRKDKRSGVDLLATRGRRHTCLAQKENDSIFALEHVNVSYPVSMSRVRCQNHTERRSRGIQTPTHKFNPSFSLSVTDHTPHTRVCLLDGISTSIYSGCICSCCCVVESWLCRGYQSICPVCACVSCVFLHLCLAAVT